MEPTDPLPPLPNAAQLAWQRREVGLFVHLTVNTFTGREWGDGTEDPAIFNPSRLDAGQWARAARAGGARIAILTAKHHDGFCLWPTATTAHSVKSSPWRGGRGDVVREFVDAMRAEGLRVGLYLSPWDRHEPSYGDSPRYNAFYLAQLRELLTGYGELDEVWFDGACGEGPNGKRQAYDWAAYFALVAELQPGAVTFGDGGTGVRWIGNERGIAGDPNWSMVRGDRVRFPGDSGIDRAQDAMAAEEKMASLQHGDESGDVWRPGEADVSIRPGWFYHAEEDDRVRSVSNLVELYFQSVGRNSFLLLNVPPTPEGLFHETDVSRLAGFRAALDGLFAEDLARGASASASSEHGGAGCGAARVLEAGPESFWSPAAGDAEPWVELRLARPAEVGVVMLQEPVQLGQRVASYVVECASGGGWREVCAGTTVGHKKLDRFEPVRGERFRVRVTRSRGVPLLSRVSLYAGGGGVG